MSSRMARLSLFIVCLVALSALPSAGQGTWSQPVNLSESPARFSTDASIAADRDGFLHVAYWEFLDADRRIYYTTNRSGVWQRSLVATSARTPILKVNPVDGRLHLFYRQEGTEAILEVTKDPGGSVWSAPSRVDASPAGGFMLDAEFDSAGGLYVAWLHLFDRSIYPNSGVWGRYRPPGGAWGPTHLIAFHPDDHHEKFPGGFNLVAWGRRIYGLYDVNGPKMKWFENGAWSAERDGAHRAAFSPSGEIAGIWAMSNPQPHSGLDWDIYVRFSYDGGLTWGPSRDVSDCPWLARSPEATYDASGNLHIFYQRKNSDPEQFDMWYVGRVNGVWLTTWNFTQTPGRTGGSLDSVLAVGNDLHYVYSDNTATGYEDVFLVSRIHEPDVTPPASVSDFTASPSDGRVYLSWRNPTDRDYTGTVIVFRTDRYPASPGDGNMLLSRRTAPGQLDSFVHSGIPNGVTVHYAAFATDPYGNISAPALRSATPLGITAIVAKTLPDGSPVDLFRKVVTAVFPADGCFYVQEEDRSSGIRVASPGTGLAVGDRVDLRGSMSTRYISGRPSERQVVSATVMALRPGMPPVALTMTGRAVGGAAFSTLAPGVIGGVGLHNMGLLVRIAGRVTATSGSYFWLDDGSGVVDPSGTRGVMVRCAQDLSAPLPGRFVAATGVVEGSIPAGQTANRRLIRMRSSADLTFLD